MLYTICVSSDNVKFCSEYSEGEVMWSLHVNTTLLHYLHPVLCHHCLFNHQNVAVPPQDVLSVLCSVCGSDHFTNTVLTAEVCVLYVPDLCHTTPYHHPGLSPGQYFLSCLIPLLFYNSSISYCVWGLGLALILSLYSNLSFHVLYCPNIAASFSFPWNLVLSTDEKILLQNI